MVTYVFGPNLAAFFTYKSFKTVVLERNLDPLVDGMENSISFTEVGVLFNNKK